MNARSYLGLSGAARAATVIHVAGSLAVAWEGAQRQQAMARCAMGGDDLFRFDFGEFVAQPFELRRPRRRLEFLHFRRWYGAGVADFVVAGFSPPAGFEPQHDPSRGQPALDHRQAFGVSTSPAITGFCSMYSSSLPNSKSLRTQWSKDSSSQNRPLRSKRRFALRALAPFIRCSTGINSPLGLNSR